MTTMVMRGQQEHQDAFEDVGTPLSVIAKVFEELAAMLPSNSEELRLAPFSDACSLVSVLFGCLGIAFKFAEMEYASKVHDLLEASKVYDTLANILDEDIKRNSVRRSGSHSRNLRRVRQGLGLIKAIFEQFLVSKGCSLKEPASIAYAHACAPYHSWAIRKAVSAGMYALPTRQQLLVKLNETESSVRKQMRRFIDASNPVILYVDKLFSSKNITLDW